MVRLSLCVLAFTGSQAARVQVSAFTNASAATSSYSMLENVALASGHLKAGEQDALHLHAKNCPWASKFDKTYKNARVVGSGATACVYLAENLEGQTVALKVGKGGSGESLSAWTEECKSMQLLRVDACKSTKRANIGDTLYDLNAMYVPTCLEVGTETENGKEVNFYVMHAAGNIELRELEESKYTKAERKSLFAQLIGAVYALHGLNTGHNDLHGGNILISEKTGKPRLALIDFGELSTPLDPTTPVIPPSTTWLFDYKRDGNAVMAWSSFLLNCPAIPEFPVVPGSSELRDRADEFSNCLKNEWGADKETIDAFAALMDKNSRQFPTQGVQRVFKAPMIQDNLPPMEKTYTWDRTDGCNNWDIKKIMEFRRETEFSAMYKCETVPTYNKVTWKTRKSGKKVKKTSQNCKFQNSACYTLAPNVGWACDAGTIKGSPCDSVALSRRANMPGKFFDGGCLTVNHEDGYKFAKVYPGYTAPVIKPGDKPHRPIFKPIVRTTTTTGPPPFDQATLPSECKCSETGKVQGVSTNKKGCKFHLSRSYGAFCYIEGKAACPGAKLSKSKGVYFRKCYPRYE